MRCPKCGGFLYRDDYKDGAYVLKSVVCMNCGYRVYERKNKGELERKGVPKKCSICGEWFTATHHSQKKCEECRRKRLRRLKCPRCGREVIVSEFARYCKECGEWVKKHAGILKMAELNEQRKAKKNKKRSEENIEVEHNVVVEMPPKKNYSVEAIVNKIEKVGNILERR